MKGIIKSSHPNANDFFSPELLSVNYKKLDRFYDKNMGPSDLD